MLTVVCGLSKQAVPIEAPEFMEIYQRIKIFDGKIIFNTLFDGSNTIFTLFCFNKWPSCKYKQCILLPVAYLDGDNDPCPVFRLGFFVAWRRCQVDM